MEGIEHLFAPIPQATSLIRALDVGPRCAWRQPTKPEPRCSLRAGWDKPQVRPNIAHSQLAARSSPRSPFAEAAARGNMDEDSPG